MTIRPRCVTRVWFIALWLSALTGWVAAQRLAAQAPPPAVGKAAQPGQEQSLSGTAGERPLDFNWDVRPILSDNCFRCHGPDAGNRRGDLRLDTADGAYAERRPGVHAVVPGTPDASEMLKRVTHANAALRMPPASTNKVLSPREIAVLRRWVVEGARYAPHWAFVPPTLPALPAVRASRPDLTPLDRFIASRLEREGLELSPRADKETLINRVSLTLTGLPPTLAEVDAFLKDQRPTAYEALVDRLLASPAYAEHVAQNWLTVARFAETDGFLGDESNRLFWPYRDWVIGAMRRNMPFNAFGTWQLAGDLLPNPTKEQRLATAFLRLGKRTTEGGVIEEEYRAEYMMERATLVGSGFLGLTVGCARCHDHKYDPISTKEFYSLGAFFNSVDEPGKYDFLQSGVQGGPTLLWSDAETEQKLDGLRAAVRGREQTRDAARAAARRRVLPEAQVLAADRGRAIAAVRTALATGLQGYYPFDTTTPIPDGQAPPPVNSRRILPPRVYPVMTLPRDASALESAPPPQPRGNRSPAQGRQTGPPAGRGSRVGGPGQPGGQAEADQVFAPAEGSAPPAVLTEPELRDGIRGKAVFNTDTSVGVLGRDIGMFERTQPFSLDFWLQPARVYDDASVLMHRDSPLSGSTGYMFTLEKNHLVFEIRHSKAGNGIRVVTHDVVRAGQWTHATATYDGSSRASGVRVYLNGVPASVDVMRDNLTRTVIPTSGGIGSATGGFLGLQFGNRYNIPGMKEGGLDEIRVFSKALQPAEVRALHDTTIGSAGQPPSAEDVADLLVAADPSVKAAEADLIKARNAENALVSRQPQVMVFADLPTPRPSYVLVRGLYSEHGDAVSPAGVEAVSPWKATWPRNRLGLAQWLFDEQHPLTARVFVNRAWQMHFGRGLVETAEDFGAQGLPPVNPALLDYLAVTFRTSGWDIQRLHKTIVMSATYQQASVSTPPLEAKDPRNLLLARYPRVRMPAELYVTTRWRPADCWCAGSAGRAPSRINRPGSGMESDNRRLSTLINRRCRRIATTAAACIRSSNATRRIRRWRCSTCRMAGAPASGVTCRTRRCRRWCS